MREDEELADICFRQALVESGPDAAFSLLAIHGQNPYAWLANPPLASQQSRAVCGSLGVRHKTQEPEEDARLDTELASQHVSTPGNRSLDSGEKETEALPPLLSTGIYAFLYRSSSEAPSAIAEHNV